MSVQKNPNYPGGTFHGVQQSWPAGMVKLGMIPIDHCLTRGNILVTERRLGDATGSDHRPLYITLKIGG